MCYNRDYKGKKHWIYSFCNNVSNRISQSMQALVMTFNEIITQINLQSIICTHPLEMPPPAEKPPEGRSTRFMTRSTLFESADNYKAHELRESIVFRNNYRKLEVSFTSSWLWNYCNILHDSHGKYCFNIPFDLCPIVSLFSPLIVYIDINQCKV